MNKNDKQKKKDKDEAEKGENLEDKAKTEQMDQLETDL